MIIFVNNSINRILCDSNNNMKIKLSLSISISLSLSLPLYLSIYLSISLSLYLSLSAAYSCFASTISTFIYLPFSLFFLLPILMKISINTCHPSVYLLTCLFLCSADRNNYIILSTVQFSIMYVLVLLHL